MASKTMAVKWAPGVQPQPLATTEAVAVFLDVPKHTLEQWRSQGKGPTYVKVGRHVRYRMADVEKWLNEQTVEAA